MTQANNKDESKSEGFGRLKAVLEHPQHKTGLQEHLWTIENKTYVANKVMRIIGTVDGDDDLQSWGLSNVAIRLSLPEKAPELAGIENAPDTTSRVYTVSKIDTNNRRLSIDVVCHDTESAMMRWIHSVQTGESITVVGPRPHHQPAAGAPRILLADSSGIPAARSIIENNPPVIPTLLIAAVYNSDETEWAKEFDFVNLVVLENTQENPLSQYFETMIVPENAVIWAAGEREDIRKIRERCRTNLKLPPNRVHVFGYWKRNTSSTQLDIARLKAGAARLERGDMPLGTDDFDIEI